MIVRHFRFFKKRKRVFRGSHAERFANRRVRVLSEVLRNQPCRLRAIRLLLIGLLKQRCISWNPNGRGKAENESENEPQTQAPQTTTLFEHLTEDSGLIYTMGILVIVQMLAYAMQDPCTC